MSTPQRKKELAAEFERKCLDEENEAARVKSLSIFDRVNEARTVEDLKDIILTIAERAGMDIYS